MQSGIILFWRVGALFGSNRQIQTWVTGNKYLLLLSLSLVLTILLRAPYFQHDFIFVDEAWWANGAQVLCRGGQLYVDIALDKNPPIFAPWWSGITVSSRRLPASVCSDCGSRSRKESSEAVAV
jgi:hypothetical protein